MIKETKEYERGFIDGMQKQMQSSVDKAVNAMGKREWIALTAKEREQLQTESYGKVPHHVALIAAVEAKLKEKNT